ncbi:MAG: ABC transporter permease, partial [Planctomycetes bacterium]|nr:ABC transporter permease [Planctomycetota bacterium]
MALSIDANWLNPLYWVGPVLDKELRVQSRRKRIYWMKGLFPVFLCLLVLIGWVSVGRGRGLSAAGMQGLVLLSRSVVSSMTWLQFTLCQGMAVMMMSHAMHDEIRRRTLDVLMTTPLRSVHIVLGKLFGQLMMVWVVLALSFPVLAIVRVWGGVPWEYLIATLCVTVCATLCVASISLFLALWVKRSHHAILIVLSFLTLSHISGMLAVRLKIVAADWFALVSPFSVFYALSADFISASGQATRAIWIPHCAVTLCVGGIFVVLCVVMLRRRILNTIRGTQKDRGIFRFVSRVVLGRRRRQACAVGGVTGAPVLWKDLGCGPRAYLVGQLP